MIDNRHFCVFDFETSSCNPSTTQVLQIGACIINKNNLEIVDEFSSLVKPDDPDTLEEGALRVNGLTKEQLEKAPPVDTIFPMWAKWIKSYNTTRDQSGFGAPIPTGWGIVNFDLPILRRYCKRFDCWDKKRDEMNLVNPIFHLDCMEIYWLLTRNNSDVKNVKLTTMAEYAGIPLSEIETRSHNAVWDVKMTASFAIRYLKLMKYLTSPYDESGKRRLEVKDCFKREK